MAGNSSSKPATVADIKRLVNAATPKQKSKRNRKKAGSNSGGSSGPAAAVGTTIANRGPSQRGLPNGAVRISNSEFVTDIYGGGSILSWDLNPNSGSLFTWLSRVAIGYELFRFTKLVFHYTPMCSTAVTGMLVMAADYDASDLPPTDKQTMSAYSGSTRGNVWNKLSCTVSPPKGWYYVGNNAGTINPTGTDIKFYDVAKFYAGIFSASVSSVVGELTVSYECEFMKPDFGPPPAMSELINCTTVSLANLAAGATYQGNLPVTVAGSGAGVLNMTFATSGSYVVQLRANLTSSTNVFGFQSSLQSNVGSNVTISVSWIDFVSNYSAANTIFAVLGYAYFDVLAGTTISVLTAATTSAVSYLQFRISPINRKAISA